MKAKLTLFMFALGLGSASVYAETPQHQCQTQCQKAYKRCTGGILTPEPNEACLQQLSDCLDTCEGL
ncbi:hypothetical protein CSQ96_14305 [Janthinobacterium sp. BJB412]|nr:hypothetical protein CSQ96_14305 [Janthinobacterium sp. BJB412]